MSVKIIPYLGKRVVDYLQENNLNINGYDEDYLNEIIDKDYFICTTCNIIMHNCNESQSDNICTYCNNPELWNK